MAERVLSIFCDESGDFGALEPHAPYYLISLVFHDQSRPVDDAVSHLEQALADEDVPRGAPIHTGPLIRRETPYEDDGLRWRRRLFSHLEHFVRHCEIRTKTFLVSKRDFGSGDALAERLAREMGAFIRDSLACLQSYDRVIVYYDKGQKQVTRVLRIIFLSHLSNVEFRTVSPADYWLFQVADLTCTLELLAHKDRRSELNESELTFFGSRRALRKDHLKLLGKVRL